MAPELALDISRADLVVFIDAREGLASGNFTIRRLERTEDAGTTWSHHLEPASLIALADGLYGHAAEAWVVAVGVESVEVGDRLSPAVEAVLPGIVDAIAGLIAGHAVAEARTIPGTRPGR